MSWTVPTGSGLTGVYSYDDGAGFIPDHTQVDSDVNFYLYGTNPVPNPPEATIYQVAWSGYLLSEDAGNYPLDIDGGDGAEYVGFTPIPDTDGSGGIIIAGTQICGVGVGLDGSNSTAFPATGDNIGTVTLAKRHVYAITIVRTDYVNIPTPAAYTPNFVVGAYWTPPGGSRAIIPNPNLFTGIATANIALSNVANAVANSLSWVVSGYTNAAGFSIYRGTSPGGEGATPIATVSSATFSYVDTAVTEGTTYYYFVQDTFYGAQSNSNEVNGTIARAINAINTVGVFSNLISWTLGPGFSSSTGYDIYRGITPSGEGGTPIGTAVAGALSYVDANLQPCQTYYYYVEDITSSRRSIEVSGQPLTAITPNVITGAVAWFNGGANMLAGQYLVSYTGGAYKINPLDFWGVQFATYDSQIEAVHALYITDGAGNNVRAPGNILPYPTAAAAIAGNAGAQVYYQHVGGKPIGIYLLDGLYSDNVDGQPSPTYTLCGPVQAIINASSTSIDVGDSTTITWSNTNGVTATDPFAGSTLSGSQSVSPTSTTTYSMTVVGISGNTQTSTVTVVVNQPAPPTIVQATGQCSGNVLITWSGGNHVASYVLERSADGASWSTAYSGSTASFTDTPPLPGTAYIYRVRSVKGSATSGPSATSTAASILPAPVPNIAATPYGGRCVVSWTLPVGFYGAITANVYRGTSSGAEILVASGLTGTSYNDTGLSNGQQYFYKASFTNECGTGSLSAEASATPDILRDASYGQPNTNPAGFGQPASETATYPGAPTTPTVYGQ